MIFLDMGQRRRVCECNINYSPEGIFHPDRVMEVYDLLYLTEGSWEIWEEDRCWPLRKGQILLLEPGKHHFSRERCTPGMRNMYIHFQRLDRDGTGEGNGMWISKLFDCSAAGRFRACLSECWKPSGQEDPERRCGPRRCWN